MLWHRVSRPASTATPIPRRAAWHSFEMGSMNGRSDFAWRLRTVYGKKGGIGTNGFGIRLRSRVRWRLRTRFVCSSPHVCGGEALRACPKTMPCRVAGAGEPDARREKRGDVADIVSDEQRSRWPPAAGNPPGAGSQSRILRWAFVRDVPDIASLGPPRLRPRSLGARRGIVLGQALR